MCDFFFVLIVMKFIHNKTAYLFVCFNVEQFIGNLIYNNFFNFFVFVFIYHFICIYRCGNIFAFGRYLLVCVCSGCPLTPFYSNAFRNISNNKPNIIHHKHAIFVEWMNQQYFCYCIKYSIPLSRPMHHSILSFSSNRWPHIK